MIPEFDTDLPEIDALNGSGFKFETYICDSWRLIHSTDTRLRNLIQIDTDVDHLLTNRRWKVTDSEIDSRNFWTRGNPL